MPHLLSDYPTEVLLPILSKMNRTSFLRLSRSCKWIHNTIQENQKHIRNYVSNDRLTIIIQRPIHNYNPASRGTVYVGYVGYGYNNWTPPPQPEVPFPLYYKLTKDNGETSGFQLYETLYNKMRESIGLRVAELEIYSKKYHHISELLVFLHSQRISCEKLTCFSFIEKPTIPPELISHLKPLKVVLLPTNQDESFNFLPSSYDYITNNVKHLSFTEIEPDNLKKTLLERDILSKASIYMHYINNFHERDDPTQFYDLYDTLLKFYKRFMATSKGKLKDFQFSCRDSIEKPYDPVLGSLEDANALLIYITGQNVPPRATNSSGNYPNREDPVFMPDPYNPQGPQIRGDFYYSPTGWSCEQPWTHYRQPEINMKKSLLLRRYLQFTDGFHHDRLIISITEGRNDKEEFILTLFADNSRRQQAYFAIAVLTDWPSYQRFLGLMDTRNFVFPMRDIEEEIKQIISPEV